jgi:regulator of Ty1 transposition protein 109
MRPQDDLVPSLGSALKSLRGPRRTLDVYHLRTEPRLCRAVFPWASDPNLKAYVEDMIVVCSEDVESPDKVARETGKDIDSKAEDAATAATTTTTTATPRSIPIFALEASLYTVPARAQSLLYVSKVDTTGLGSSPSPARLLTTAFLRHFPRSRIHIFARAQAQYLFPGSGKNPGKRVLDDKALCAWWRRTVEVSAPPRAYWLLAGYSELEAKQLVPAFRHVAKEEGESTTAWTYGHPYAADGHLGDLIPAFTDDPKSRFLTELTSSTQQPSGEEDDWDDAFHTLSSMSAFAAQPRREKIEADKKRERARLDGVSVEEFWERMGWRQECCSGQLVGFFVVEPREAKKPSTSASPSRTTTAATAPSSSPPRAHHSALPHAAYVSLWSSLHNVDYSSAEKVATAHLRWKEGLRAIFSGDKWAEVHSRVTVEGGATAPPQSLGSGSAVVVGSELKRELVEEPKVVNVLAPRKKPKVAAPAAAP